MSDCDGWGAGQRSCSGRCSDSPVSRGVIRRSQGPEDLGEAVRPKERRVAALLLRRRLWDGIRVIAGGALGFAATNDMSRGSVNGIARKAVKLAKASSGVLKKPIEFDDSKPAKRGGPRRKRRRWRTPTHLARKVLHDIEGRIADGKAGVKIPGRFLVLGAELEERYYVNSDGARVEGRLPRVGFFGSLTAVEGGATAQRFIQAGETGGLEVVKRIRLVEKVEEEAKVMGKVPKAGGQAAHRDHRRRS